ncbi:type I-E CRISPR-associated endoribonuclease Cas2e [uncultured Acidaminococcus sp.]|uniref:type I-E CRISPR-associated endoribonuclease Cas2e n=1 Tax=uncultured Acidaminococcus sp. TaxID=352152 RepID=UPI002627FDDE|nr:type I-E CRISPR-associated endoribonuclease Cas2e [uncultured Acidaminococcus sp.]
MIVVTVTNCPPSLRGDLTKWLFEINTGVYVGRVSARVREELWKRICSHLKDGQATMVFNAANEQGMDFYTWNSAWEPVDLDGIKLMLHPLLGNQSAEQNSSRMKSNAEIHLMAKKRALGQNQYDAVKNYTVVDLETTGLDPLENRIIEFGAVQVRNGKVTETFSQLIRITEPLPPDIQKLTGITMELLEKEGVSEKEGLDAFLEFIEEDQLLLYNASFDMNFLVQACLRYAYPTPENHCVDVMLLAKKKIRFIPNYKLSTIAEHFGLEKQKHRALADCLLTNAVFVKLNEKGS